MAAITPDGKNELVALYLTMFGRAPTTIQLANLVAARENDSTLTMVATTLSSESDFALISAMDSDAFAVYLADALFASDIPASARAWAINWFVTQLQNTKSKPQIIAEAVQAIRSTSNTSYATSKAELATDVENALQAIDGSFTLGRALEIGLDKLPVNYQLNSGEIDFGVNTVAQISEKLLATKRIIEKSFNSKEVVLIYSYSIKDYFENLIKNYLLVDAASSYSMLDASVSLGNDLTVSEYHEYEMTRKLEIINNADNKNSIKLIYTIKDTIENLSAINFKEILNSAANYKIGNPSGNLGIITIEQLAILKGAENYIDYTYIDLEDVSTVNSILLDFGLTAVDAKNYILQHAENIDEIASALKKANLTVGEMAAILASSSGVDDPPIILSENKIKEYFNNFVADYRVEDGQINIQGDSDDNILLGTNASEVFSGGEGEDSVVYDGEISRYKITRLYEGKSKTYSGFNVQNFDGAGSVDNLNTDVEYIVFRDQHLKIPTSGKLIQGTLSEEKITGDSTNDILLGVAEYTIFTGGDGIDTAVIMGDLIDNQITKLYEGKNGAFSGYNLARLKDGSDVAKISNDIEFIQFYDQKIELATFLDGNVQPLSFDFTISDNHLQVGESAVLNFKFSEAVSGFSVEDIVISGGEISNLRGLGDSYYANFKNLGESVNVNLDIKNESVRSNIGEVYVSDQIRNIDAILDVLLNGESPNSILNGGAGNDIFKASSPCVVNGGAGFDQIWINGNRDNYTVSVKDGLVTLTLKNNINSVVNSFDLTSIERVHFLDNSLAFDMDGNAGVVASILYMLVNPQSVYLPGYVGVGLANLEKDFGLALNLLLVAAKFSLQPRLVDFYSIFSKVSENLNRPYYSVMDQIWKSSDLLDPIEALAMPPSNNPFANSDLLGIEYLEYMPQYL